MKVGQLWYTRVLHGAGATNQLQIVAASGRLADRTQPLTNAILTSCYRPAHPGATLSWVEERGARIVAHRVAAPPDATGRPGNFFVHALVGSADALPDEKLGQLWGAPGWRVAVPDELEAKLPSLASIDELDLAPSPAIDRRTSIAVVAGFLANTRQFRPTALDLPPAEAAVHAAFATTVLPDRFDLISFCSNPDDGEIDRYEIVAGRPSSTRFVLVDPSAEPEPVSAAMATVLLDAHDGEPRASAVVEAITDRSEELVHLADGLHHWVLLDRPDGVPGAAPPSEAIGFIQGDPRLALALAEGPGCGALAEAVATGVPGAAELVAFIESIDAIDPLRHQMAALLSRSEPEAAVGALRLLAARAPASAGQVARDAVHAWADQGALARLSGRAQADLLAMIAATNPQSQKAPELLTTDASADLVAGNANLPDGWRTKAVWRHPTSVREATAARVLLEVRGFTTELTANLSDPLVDLVKRMLLLVPPATAVATATRFEPVLRRTTIERMVRAAIERMPALDRIAALEDLAARWTHLPSAWSGLLSGALKDAVVEAAKRPAPAAKTRNGLPAVRHAGGPPYASIAPLIGAIDLPTTALLAWEPFCRAFAGLLSTKGLDLTTPCRQTSAAIPQLEPAVQDAAQVLLHRTVRYRSIDIETWWSHSAATLDALDHPDRDRAWRALVQVTREVPNQNVTNSARYWTVAWLAAQMSVGALPKDIVGDPLISDLALDLTVTDKRDLGRLIDRKDGKSGRMITKLMNADSRKLPW